MKIINDTLELDSYELTIFEHSYNAIIITTTYLNDEHPKILYANQAFLKMTGYSVEEIINKTPRILQGEKTDRNVLQRLKECLIKEEHFEGRAINYRKDGKEYWVEWNISPVYDNDKKLIAFLSIQKDISVLNEIKLFQTAIDQNNVSIAFFNTNGDYIYVNKAYAQRTGYSVQELIGNNPRILKSGYHTENFYKKLWENLLNKSPFSRIFCNKNAYGELYYEKQTITPIVEQNQIIGFVIIGKNYDKEQEHKEQLEEDLFTDELTKLYNKRAFDKKFNTAVEDYFLNKKAFGMMFIDLDNFKQVNDNMGHDKGDEALKEVANFLRDNLRKSDEIFRFGGDEFIILLYEPNKNNASKISSKLEELFKNSSIAINYKIGMSIGYKEYRGENIEFFFKETDKQMYNRKKTKKVLKKELENK